MRENTDLETFVVELNEMGYNETWDSLTDHMIKMQIFDDEVMPTDQMVKLGYFDIDYEIDNPTVMITKSGKRVVLKYLEMLENKHLDYLQALLRYQYPFKPTVKYDFSDPKVVLDSFTADPGRL